MEKKEREIGLLSDLRMEEKRLRVGGVKWGFPPPKYIIFL